MTAKKSAKPAAKKKAASRKGDASGAKKKPAAKKPAAKKPAAKKAAPKKAARKVATKKAAEAKAPAPAKAAAPATGSPPEKATKSTGTIAPEVVNLGHLFALRPRVNTKFPPEAFRRAKDDLRDERYETVEDAARAVADKALGATRKKPGKNQPGRR